MYKIQKNELRTDLGQTDLSNLCFLFVSSVVFKAIQQNQTRTTKLTKETATMKRKLEHPSVEAVPNEKKRRLNTSILRIPST